jgi:NAD(P)-dependent dehydrogenase (short-subunit alcohol dehydrogenase family)
MGGLDALVHVAGVILRRDLEEVSESDWDHQHDVNLKATFFLCREVARTMRSTGTRGSLVTFTSQGWWTGGFGGSVVYAASKGGVVSLTRGLARTLAADGIRVNVVAPGFIDTDMMREGLSDQARADLVGQVPLGRMGDPGEVAAAALFLVSDASSYMTGTTLNLSGGQLSY